MKKLLILLSFAALTSCGTLKPTANVQLTGVTYNSDGSMKIDILLNTTLTPDSAKTAIEEWTKNILELGKPKVDSAGTHFPVSINVPNLNKK